MNPGTSTGLEADCRPGHRHKRVGYIDLDRLGRRRLSKHFFMRDFLYSEIAIAFGIQNVPDDPDLAIASGTRLCEEVLEPLVSRFGPIHIRSGFRSAKLNAFGAGQRLNCAKNEANYAYHIWDHRDQHGHTGAAACIVLPRLVDRSTTGEEWRDLAWLIHDTLPYHRLTFFRRNYAFNIGWHEAPRREILSYIPKRHWVHKSDDAPLLPML